MPANVKINETEMNNTAAGIESEISLIETSFRRITESVNAFLSEWDGESRTRFFKLLDEDAQFFYSHIKSLRELNERLRQSARIYADSEEEAEQIFNRGGN